jgi:hypothetical protein
MSMLRRGATSVVLLLLAAAASYAQEDPKAYTIDEASVRINNLGPAAQPDSIQRPDIGAGAEDALVIIDQIINLGQKIWPIIEANKPSVNIQTQYGTATPQGITNWSQLAGWKPPEGTVYGFTAKNVYGMKVVDVKYQVLRTYGGSYNGKGKYLTAVTIQPLSVDVVWGYKFNLSMEIPDSSLVNVGTAQDPVAAMQPVVKWTIATVVKESDGRSTYYVQGDGLFKDLGGPFAKNYQDNVAKALDNTVEYKFQ